MNQDVTLKELGPEDKSENGPVWHRLDYDKDAIIEASAGTGKTYTLERIVLKLVCEKGYDIRNLLLVTFTEKAAGELKDRIRRILTDAGADMSHFDEATIGTIHSFCRELLAEYPFETGMQMSLDVAGSDRELISKAVHDTIASEKFRTRYGKDYGELMITHGCKSTDQLEGKVAAIVGRAIGCGPEAKREADIKNFRESVRSLSCVQDSAGDGKTSVSVGAYITSNLTKAKTQYSAYFSILDDWIMEALSTNDAKCSAIKSILDGKTNFTGYTWKGEKKTGSGNEFCKVFPQIDHLKAMVEGLGTRLRRTFVDEVAQMAWEEYRRIKAQTKRITFDDMVLETSKAIADASQDTANMQKQAFLNSIRSKYRIALVDEFQDTDDKQWRIFSTLFSAKNNKLDGTNPEQGCLIVVGDPKQAIYSFRGADIATYLRAKEEIISSGGQKFSLDKMYRSTKEMVDAFNAVFRADDWFTDMRVGSGAIEYEKSVEFPDDAPDALKKFNYPDGEHAVEFIESLPDGEEQGNRNKCLPLYMENAALEMKRLHERGFWRGILPWHEMCVLVRSNSDGDVAQKVLRSYGIPCMRYKEAGLFDSPESESVLALFDYLANPTNSGNLAALLLTPFFRVSLGEVESRMAKNGARGLDALCDKWRTLVSECEWERFFESAMTDTELGKPHPEDMDFLRRRTGVRQIFDRFLEQCGRAKSLHELITALRAWKRDDERAGENGSVRNKESDADAVQIMTMHVSKGLERGAVFVTWGFGEIVSSKLVPEKAERPAAEQEMRRLLYVALTRAKYKLYLPWSKEAPDGGFGSNGSALQGKFLANGIKALIAANMGGGFRGENLIAKNESQIEVHMADGVKKIPSEFLPPTRGMRSWRHHWDSFSSLNHPKTKEVLHTAAGGTKEDDEVRAGTPAENRQSEKKTLVKKGALSGTVFHEVMERLCLNDESQGMTGFAIGWKSFEDATKEADEVKSDLMDIIRRRMAANGMRSQVDGSETTELALARMVWNALRTEIKIGDDTFKLYEIEFKDRKAEVGFVYDEKLIVDVGEDAPGALNGSIDLVIRRPDGRYVILDWKTNALPNYETATVKEEMKEAGYRLQYKIYTLAAEKWLGKGSVKGVAYVFVRGGEYGENPSGLFVEEVLDREYYRDRVRKALGVRAENESANEKEAR